MRLPCPLRVPTSPKCGCLQPPRIPTRKLPFHPPPLTPPVRPQELRATGVRLTCYLNCDSSGYSHGTIVKLPVECDTIPETIQKIQARMKLDSRMLYASELWLPDGRRVGNFEELYEAAANHTPIIVGCGEPFDSTHVPTDLAEFHREGGALHKASRKVHKQLTSRRKQALHDKAETVRAAGHGINSEAAAVARGQNTEMNREHVIDMRRAYMESLVQRAAQHEDLMQSVKSNIEYHRAEAAESRARQNEQALERMQRLKDETRALRAEQAAAKATELAKRRAMADKVRAKKSGEKSSRYASRAAATHSPPTHAATTKSRSHCAAHTFTCSSVRET